MKCFLILFMAVLPLVAFAQKNGGQKRRSSKQATTRTATKKRSLARPQAVNNKTFTVNGVSFTMVEVEGGTFTMGATSEQGNDYDSDEKPTHHVTLSSFYIGQTEVTHALWHAVMGGDPIDLDKANMPVEFVSWDDCQVFVRKLSSLTGEHFRLPTESEWEYAARGGNRSRGYKYSGSNNLGSVAWYHKNSGEKPHNVATKQPNELDIYDMSGNVWEWCQDWLGDYDSSSQFDQTGPAEGTYRVHRGGCFTLFEAFDDKSWTCRVSARHGCTPEFSDFYVGLRLAMDYADKSTFVNNVYKNAKFKYSLKLPEGFAPQNNDADMEASRGGKLFLKDGRMIDFTAKKMDYKNITVEESLKQGIEIATPIGGEVISSELKDDRYVVKYKDSFGYRANCEVQRNGLSLHIHFTYPEEAKNEFFKDVDAIFKSLIIK